MKIEEIDKLCILFYGYNLFYQHRPKILHNLQGKTFTISEVDLQPLILLEVLFNKDLISLYRVPSQVNDKLKLFQSCNIWHSFSPNYYHPSYLKDANILHSFPPF